jgi:hypothetical protein
MNSRAIKDALADFKRTEQKLPLIIIDDLHYALKAGKSGVDLVSSLIVWGADEALVSVIFVGSEPIVPAIEAAQVPGRSRIETCPKFVVKPLTWGALQSPFLQAAKRIWITDSPDTQQDTVNWLGYLIGTRMKDIGDVLRKQSAAASLQEARDLVQDAATKIQNVLDSLDELDTQPKAVHLLLSLLKNDGGIINRTEFVANRLASATVATAVIQMVARNFPSGRHKQSQSHAESHPGYI